MKKVAIAFLVIISILGISGCANNENNISNKDLICESIISPNEDYVKSEDDKVVLEVKVYQNKENTIIVTAKDNTEFFEDKEYTVKYDKDISESDINIEWTTLMGNDEPTKEDQKVVATVKILQGSEVISERKINFAKNAIDIII